MFKILSHITIALVAYIKIEKCVGKMFSFVSFFTVYRHVVKGRVISIASATSS